MEVYEETERLVQAAAKSARNDMKNIRREYSEAKKKGDLTDEEKKNYRERYDDAYNNYIRIQLLYVAQQLRM